MSAKQAERLEKTLARVAREQGLDQERLRRWVSFLALCGVLEQALERGVIDTYYLKGGVAMELRFARAARTTKDFDLGLEGNRQERLRRLEDLLRLEFDAFTFRLKPEIHEMELADTVRVEVAVQYKTRAWQTVEIDLGPGGAREVDLVEPAITGLAEMGLPITPHVRCLGLNEQVAQKLHACTGPQRKDRARDVLDILLVDMLGQLDYARTRAAAERIFAERATHDFPPAATLPPEWGRELENLAQELGYRTTDREGIQTEFGGVLQAITTANAT
ncbi:MAG: nucleotidyl transferase AbiEii/AbiGii toxin family protein [Acidobacteria bacterium]|nr:nucleotidyl transferase AbiEii/AbiGii toxin family protein [Acidobacteriota bacterium]